MTILTTADLRGYADRLSGLFAAAAARPVDCTPAAELGWLWGQIAEIAAQMRQAATAADCPLCPDNPQVAA